MSEEKKKKGSPLIWILLAGCGCFILIACACVGLVAYAMTTDEFKDEYCKSLVEQNFDLREDPLGLCN